MSSRVGAQYGGKRAGAPRGQRVLPPDFAGRAFRRSREPVMWREPPDFGTWVSQQAVTEVDEGGVFLWSLFSFSGDVGMCPECGEYVSFTAVFLEDEQQMR